METNEDEDTEETQEVTAAVTHHTRTRARGNAAVRQQQALDLRSMGATFDEIARRCGYSHRSVARRAVMAAARDIAEDTAEEMRLTFRASYGPIRQTLHKLARRGDVSAVLALVRLDERECRLFGLDLSPDAQANATQYTKRIILESTDGTLPVLQVVPPSDSSAVFGQNGYVAHLDG